MTAEVVILNKSAAVLAADSAVTIQAGGTRKMYNSASKIAMLSREPPIGAIVYGRADLLGVPWESIKRMYHDHLKAQGKLAANQVTDVATVADCFFKWLDQKGDWLFSTAAKGRAIEATDAALNKLSAGQERPTRRRPTRRSRP